MKEWFRFIVSNKRLLNFGFQFNFFSAFGQTFFISLYVPFWVEAMDISNTEFGSMYATVTIISAFLLSATGRYIDRLSLRTFGLIVFAGLVISVILLSQAYTLITLMIGLFLVRWLGQGMMTHTSSTGIAKQFQVNRGKALGFTALGHSVSQFILPFLTLSLINFVGWRTSLIYMTLVCSVIMLPSLWAITPVIDQNSSKSAKVNSETGRANYFTSLKFWIIAVNTFLVPFICTAVFLYQYTIGKSKGLDASWVAFSFSFYAIFSAVSLLVSGNLVDRFTGVRLFPLYLLPTLFALLLMAFSRDKWIFPLFYALLGLSAGFGSTIKPAMQVEIYGSHNLGKIRSYFSTLLVLSTAFGPPAFGYFIDHQYSYNTIMLIFAGLTLIIFGVSFRLWKYKN